MALPPQYVKKASTQSNLFLSLTSRVQQSQVTCKAIKAQNKAKAISAKVIELNFKVPLYSQVICMTNLAIFGSNYGQN